MQAHISARVAPGTPRIPARPVRTPVGPVTADSPLQQELRRVVRGFGPPGEAPGRTRRRDQRAADVTRKASCGARPLAPGLERVVLEGIADGTPLEQLVLVGEHLVAWTRAAFYAHHGVAVPELGEAYTTGFVVEGAANVRQSVALQHSESDGALRDALDGLLKQRAALDVEIDATVRRIQELDERRACA